MNQEQKDTIREEFRMTMSIHSDERGKLQDRTIDNISDFWLSKLDQEYQQGAKDKVEEVSKEIEQLRMELLEYKSNLR